MSVVPDSTSIIANLIVLNLDESLVDEDAYLKMSSNISLVGCGLLSSNLSISSKL